MRPERSPRLPKDATIAWNEYLASKTTPFDNSRAADEAKRAFFYAFEAGKRAKDQENAEHA